MRHVRNIRKPLDGAIKPTSTVVLVVVLLLGKLTNAHEQGSPFGDGLTCELSEHPWPHASTTSLNP